MDDDDAGIRLGHATMDIRYHQGGYEPTTVLPGQGLTMLMEFQAMDVILPAGNWFTLTLSSSGEDYLPPARSALCPVSVSGGTLSLPVIDRDGSNILITPQSEDAANN